MSTNYKKDDIVKFERCSIAFHPHTREYLKRLADERFMTTNSLITEILGLYVEQHEKGIDLLKEVNKEEKKPSLRLNEELINNIKKGQC